MLLVRQQEGLFKRVYQTWRMYKGSSYKSVTLRKSCKENRRRFGSSWHPKYTIALIQASSGRTKSESLALRATDTASPFVRLHGLCNVSAPNLLAVQESQKRIDNKKQRVDAIRKCVYL
jgi:hypothetical protein